MNISRRISSSLTCSASCIKRLIPSSRVWQLQKRELLIAPTPREKRMIVIPSLQLRIHTSVLFMTLGSSQNICQFHFFWSENYRTRRCWTIFSIRSRWICNWCHPGRKTQLNCTSGFFQKKHISPMGYYGINMGFLRDKYGFLKTRFFHPLRKYGLSTG